MATEYKSLYEARKELRKMRRAERKEFMKKQSKEMVQAYEEAERNKQIEARRSII